MASLRHLSLRFCPTRPINTSKWLQRRWARVHDVRFVTQQASERVTDRYKDLLEKKAKKEGLQDVNQLKEAYKDKIQDLRKKAAVPGATAPLSGSQQQPSHSQQPQGNSPWPTPPPPPQPQQAQQKKGSSNPGLKTLSSYIDIEKTMDLPQKEIEAIWRLRHAQNPQSLCAAVSTPIFKSIHATARKHPQFILPGLPRKQVDGEANADDPAPEGAPIHFMQWTFPGPDTVTVIFTHLAEYKLRGEYAQPHTTLTHHLELADAKGLVLSEGLVVPDRGVSLDEGKWLIMNMQKFYNTQPVPEIDTQPDRSEVGKELAKKRRELIEKFNKGDTSFKIEELLDQTERLG